MWTCKEAAMNTIYCLYPLMLPFYNKSFQENTSPPLSTSVADRCPWHLSFCDKNVAGQMNSPSTGLAPQNTKFNQKCFFLSASKLCQHHLLLIYLVVSCLTFPPFSISDNKFSSARSVLVLSSDSPFSSLTDWVGPHCPYSWICFAKTSLLGFPVVLLFFS